jgi:hypothetical protein
MARGASMAAEVAKDVEGHAATCGARSGEMSGLRQIVPCAATVRALLFEPLPAEALPRHQDTNMIGAIVAYVHRCRDRRAITHNHALWPTAIIVGTKSTVQSSCRRCRPRLAKRVAARATCHLRSSKNDRSSVHRHRDCFQPRTFLLVNFVLGRHLIA